MKKKKKERKKRKQPELSNEIVQTFFFVLQVLDYQNWKGTSKVQSSFELSTFHVGLTTISKTKSHTGCVTIGLQAWN